jgi:NADH:ubiquinone oxidoreductase subunit E
MKATRLAAAAVLACVAILLTDDMVARRRAPHDDEVLKAAPSPERAAELVRVTAARLARKSRDGAVAWALIGSSAIFLMCAKRGAPLRVASPAHPPGASGRPTMKWSTSFHPASRQQPAPAAELDLAFLDQLIAKHGRAKEDAIPLLGAIQSHCGYLPDEALRRLCELTEITPAQISGTSTFYSQFRHSPTGKHLVRVCHGTACHVSGARQISDELGRYLGIPAGADTDPSRMFTVEEVACLGCCSLAPVLMVDGNTAGRLTPSAACEALIRFAAPFAEKETM